MLYNVIHVEITQNYATNLDYVPKLYNQQAWNSVCVVSHVYYTSYNNKNLSRWHKSSSLCRLTAGKTQVPRENQPVWCGDLKPFTQTLVIVTKAAMVRGQSVNY